MTKKLELVCWYGFVKSRDLTSPKHNLRFWVRGFWVPAPAWQSLNSGRYPLNNFFSPRALFLSLRPLFKVGDLFPLLNSFAVVPRTSSFTTVTRGPMVRKKQSREQVGFSNQIAVAGFKLSYFQRGNLTYSGPLLGAFFSYHWALLNPYLFGFNFLFFQQTAVVSALSIL